MTALSEENMVQDSIIVFASDNGGAPEGYGLNQGSNWPLRGVCCSIQKLIQRFHGKFQMM